MKKSIFVIFVCIFLAVGIPLSSASIGMNFKNKMIQNKPDTRESNIVISNNNVNTQWDKTIGGSEIDHCLSAIQVDATEYIITGFTDSFGAGKRDAWLVKIDEDGNEKWSKTYGSADDEWGGCIENIPSSGFIIAGGKGDYDSDGSDVMIIKTDEDGNKIWDKTYGGDKNEWANSIICTDDGGYILVGGTASYGAGDFDIWTVKLDEDGEEQWNKTFGTSNYEIGHSIIHTDDEGYVILAECSSYYGFDIWLIKINPEGSEEWTEIISGMYDYAGYHLLKNNNGEFIITGCTSEFQSGFYLDVLLIKTDSQGNIDWNRLFYRNDFDCGNFVSQTSDDGYIITGIADFNIFTGIGDIWVIKTDSNGNKIWESVLGGQENDEGRFAHQTSDGGFIVIGNTDSYGAGKTDIWLVKIDSIDNQIPNKPQTPEGTVDGKIRTEYTYTCRAVDPDDNQLYYLWDWGNGAYTDWLGPYDSGQPCEVGNIWYNKGTYEIKVKVKDSHGGEGDWSDPLTITMPRGNQLLFNTLIQRILERFPNALPLLSMLIRQLER